MSPIPVTVKIQRHVKCAACTRNVTLYVRLTGSGDREYLLTDPSNCVFFLAYTQQPPFLRHTSLASTLQNLNLQQEAQRPFSGPGIIAPALQRIFAQLLWPFCDYSGPA